MSRREADLRMRDLVEEQGLAGDLGERLLGEGGLGHAREDRRIRRPCACRSPTWRTIVPVSRSKVAGSFSISLPYLRWSRSAASWIGVSGFLISWAIRRATSDQAARRWSSNCSVMSSKVSTWPPFTLHRLHRQRPRLAARGELDDVLALLAGQLAVELGREIGELLADRALAAGLEQILGRAVDQPDDMVVVDRDHARRHPGQHRLGEGAPAVELGIGGDQGAGLLLEPAGHAVEGVAERRDLVPRRRSAAPAPKDRRR